MVPLGTPAPPFELPNAIDGKLVSLHDFHTAKALLVMFICNHCPFVVHVQSQFGKLATDYMPKGLAMVAVNSNSLRDYPHDGPENMKKLAIELKWPFPFLLDATQKVARAYEAACTPDFFLFDGSHNLVYRGQLDDSRPRNQIPVTGRDLRAAIDCVLSGKPVTPDQKPSVGCNIKWET